MLLALCVLAVVGNVIGVEGPWRRVLAVALGLALTVPLLARRRFPLGVLAAVVGATWLQFAILGPSAGALGSWIAYLVATYSVGAHPATWRAVVGLAGSIGAGGRVRGGAAAGRRRRRRTGAAGHGPGRRLGGRPDIGPAPAPGRPGRAAGRPGGIRRGRHRAGGGGARAHPDRPRTARRGHPQHVGDGGPGAGRPDPRGLRHRTRPRGHARGGGRRPFGAGGDAPPARRHPGRRAGGPDRETGPRSPDWTTCPGWCNAYARPDCRCRTRSTATPTGCPPHWRCARTGSCRRRCPTWSGTAAP